MSQFVDLPTGNRGADRISIHYTSIVIVEDTANGCRLFIRIGNQCETVHVTEDRQIVISKIDAAAKADKTEWTT